MAPPTTNICFRELKRLALLRTLTLVVNMAAAGSLIASTRSTVVGIGVATHVVTSNVTEKSHFKSGANVDLRFRVGDIRHTDQILVSHQPVLPTDVPLTIATTGDRHINHRCVDNGEK